ncbi:MAG TPA: LD-carboxypeptidase [Chitinophagaceae bacterium]|nr:LD-carboxypeptidase [Chitinophagaceae bacterium]
MNIPPCLKPGDLIGVTCPASRMERQAAEYAAGVLASWGFQVRIGETVGGQFHNFSAPDNRRLRELQGMLNDDAIKAILFGRGGYGVIRLLDQLDFSHFKKHPKWLCGYSDITALHMHIYKCFGIATIHSLMCSGITADTHDDPYVDSLRRVLMGEDPRYEFPAHSLNRNGESSGELIGGNLSLLACLSGTISQPDTAGRLLFIEDIGEYRYAVDRMMFNLKRSGWLNNLQGLLVGGFTGSRETDEPFGQTEYEIIYDKVKEYDYPVAFGFPAGHQKENYTLKMGTPCTMKISDEKGVVCW